MKAAQYHPDIKKIQINEIPIPRYSETEMLIRMASASLCHSDIHALEGTSPVGTSSKPVTLGHEGVGYVEEIGPDVKGFEVGDRVGFLYIRNVCFECDGCQVHNLHCEKGAPLLQGFTADGFFAEYAVVDYRNAIVLPQNLKTETSAPLFCAGITAFHSVDHCELAQGNWLAVVGCGGLGQAATQYAKAMGYKVAGIDIDDAPLAQVQQLGADLILNSSRDPTYIDKLRATTGGGMHAAAVFSASTAAYHAATQLLRLNGVLMVVGLPSKPLQIDLNDLVIGKYRIRSTSTDIPQRMRRAIQFTAKHNIQPNVISFHRLEEVPDMIEKMKAEKTIGRMAVLF